MTELQDLERAVKAVLVGASLTTVAASHIYKGMDFPDGGSGIIPTKVELPCIIVTAETGSHYAHPTALNVKAQLSVLIRTQRDDETDEEHRLRVREVALKLAEVDIRTQLSAAIADFTVLHIVNREVSHSPTKRYWETRQTYEVACGSATLA